MATASKGADRVLNQLPVDDPHAYLATLRAQRQQIAAGHTDVATMRAAATRLAITREN